MSAHTTQSVHGTYWECILYFDIGLSGLNLFRGLRLPHLVIHSILKGMLCYLLSSYYFIVDLFVMVNSFKYQKSLSADCLLNVKSKIFEYWPKLQPSLVRCSVLLAVKIFRSTIYPRGSTMHLLQIVFHIELSENQHCVMMT